MMQISRNPASTRGITSATGPATLHHEVRPALPPRFRETNRAGKPHHIRAPLCPRDLLPLLKAGPLNSFTGAPTHAHFSPPSPNTYSNPLPLPTTPAVCSPDCVLNHEHVLTARFSGPFGAVESFPHGSPPPLTQCGHQPTATSPHGSFLCDADDACRRHCCC
jgi:hypothetical protein